MKSEISRYFFQMVKIDSESGEEKEFLQFLSNLFKKELNAETKFDNYSNLIIKIKAKNSDKKEPVLFCCHGDTVNPGKGIEPILKDGVIYSGGNTILGADDKAGITEILMALKGASQYPPVEIVITRQEEIGLSGSSFLDKNLIKAKKGYVIDSEALDEIIIGGPSRAEITINITGKASHAVHPENGISAIEVAANAISLLQTGWIDNETTVNVGLIKGGHVLNAVPENTTVQIECRSQNHQKCVRQSKIIKKTFDTVAKAKGAKADIQMSMELKASHISENAEVVRIAKRAIESAGLKPKARIICGGTDASNLNQKGIKTAVLGTGGKLPHSKGENIAIKDIEKAIEIIKEILKEYS